MMNGARPPGASGGLRRFAEVPRLSARDAGPDRPGMVSPATR